MNIKHTFEGQNKKENKMNINKKRKQKSAIHTTIARIALVTIMGGLLLSACGADEPQVYRVGILSGLDFFADSVASFQAEMTELGYVEGENIVYDVHTMNVDMAAYRSALQGFVEDEVDLIFVFPTEAAAEAKAATEGTDIPVLFANSQIEGSGLVNSVREPGGNITGVRLPGPEIALRNLDILRQLAPEAERILVPYQRDYPIGVAMVEALHPAAEAAGITLIELPASTAAELETELQARAESGDIGLDAIVLIPGPLAGTPDCFMALTTFAAEHKVPIGGAIMDVGDHGSIFEVNIDPVATGKQAAPLADKILKDTPAGEIPVVSAENYIKIDYRVAQELGVELPESLLGMAAEIIR
jgi:putative ABC transport system substrate-binding protein